MTNAAIYFHPDGYDTTTGRLMGRHSAGESFLRGFLRHAEVDKHYLFNAVQAGRTAELEGLIQRIEPLVKPYEWIERRQRGRLSAPGCLYLPQPSLALEAWTRRPLGARHYSICGVTHTTATHRIMDSLADMLTAPVQSWDGLVCTSRAVRAAVEAQFQAVGRDLAERLGATRITTPQLATIPLGLNADDFAPSPLHRAAWREKLGIPSDALVVLYVGRLSATAKMNPGPMAIALEAAAKATGREIYWVVSGWARTEEMTQQHHQRTQALCPSVHYRAVDGREPETRFSIWSVADIFLSLSDNIQETFGLTPIEAMAAGLPSVVSDWDGYRDTVRHGIDGYRIATWAPRPSLGRDLAYQYANDWIGYDLYVSAAAQMTAVDLRTTVEALVALIGEPDRRAAMGAAARRRALEVFDWSVIIPQYQALWGELAARRAAADPTAVASRPNVDNPRRLDPFRQFAAYPTQPLRFTDVIALAPGQTRASAQALLAQPLMEIGRWALPTAEEIALMFDRVEAAGHLSVEDLTTRFSQDRAPFVERAILWMAKFGLFEISGDQPALSPTDVTQV